MASTLDLIIVLKNNTTVHDLFGDTILIVGEAAALGILLRLTTDIDGHIILLGGHLLMDSFEVTNIKLSLLCHRAVLLLIFEVRFGVGIVVARDG